jgi:hypothetical protein
MLKNDLLVAFVAIEDFHTDVTAILRSCKTVKQLEGVLPEAAALLPKPVKNVTELAPVELRKAVQDRLKSGIPPKERV